MDFPVFSTTIYFTAVVGDEKFAGQTVIQSADAAEYEKALGDFFSTLAHKVDSDGQTEFVTFEPRAVAGGSSVAGSAAPKAPLNEAPSDVPNCPFHNVPLKEKTNRSTGQKFFGCSERKADGGYCNWSPPRKN